MEKITKYLIQGRVFDSRVEAWEEEIMLPTYEIGKDEKNPVFLEKRVYQGSSGSVYPYPVVEKIFDEKKEKPYRALFVENEYIKVMVLPELGGRIQMAYDKIKGRHFIYYNQVVKPALVGLTGPWISGGIEFNWPQHHRPSTFLPTSYSIESHKDGSKTIWCSEVERMFRTKGMHGFRVYPGRAYIEINAKVYNRTAFPQTFLWWANPAVFVNDDYHSVFPPDVHAVFDHGKRDVSNFPIATGIYYKQDYSAGVDISKYKNIPVPTSYMAIKSKYDFVGGYDEGVKGGLLHVADHNVSPGKKQWTWGCGDFGRAWDRNLTDEDGPYIELMTGVYTDNQPDFSWLQPYEQKSWTQYFMPYAEVGYVKNATKEAILNVEVQNQHTKVLLYTTGEYKQVKVVLRSVQGKVYLDETIDISPRNPFVKEVFTEGVKPEELICSILAADGRKMVEYQAEAPELKPVPEPAKAAKDPKEISSIEQLFLTGLHLEQYRHATYNPMDYYEEALEREPGDVRCNNAVGLLYMRKGKFAKAEPYFRKAIETLTERNPNPYDGEPLYHLGRCLQLKGEYDEAYESYFKATWNAAWQDAAYFGAAQIDCMKQRYDRALEQVERSLLRNWHNHKGRQLKASVLRKLGQEETAVALIDESLQIDRFNIGCLYEKYLLTKDETITKEITDFLKGRVHEYIEYALDFAAAGLYDEAIGLLQLYLLNAVSVYPMVYYSMGYFHERAGRTQEAKEYYLKAEQCSPDYCFPNRIEEVNILQAAVAMNPSGAKAYYYLGNFFYAARIYEDAIRNWEKSIELDDTFPTVLRNLSLAYYNKKGEKEQAVALLEKAFYLTEDDARILMELDQLYKKLGRSHAERLALLEKYQTLTDSRDDLQIERITLYNQLGDYETAAHLISEGRFHPWEGGEGKITGQYLFSNIARAKQALREQKYEQAVDLLERSKTYPYNLGEGKLECAEENDIDYYLGIAYQGMNESEKAHYYFNRATIGSSEPAQAFFYNDQQPDKIFYQGLALRALGQESQARGRFNKLIDYGKKHIFDQCRIDYFAVSLPDLAIWDDDLNKRNVIHCNYVMGLGYLGLKDKENAKKYLQRAYEADINNQGVVTHLNMIEELL